MLKNLYKKFNALYDKQVDGKGLAIFRIAFSIVLLAEVLQLIYFQHLIFDKIPYLVPGEIEMWPLFFFWVIIILFLIFGLYTRIAAIINYLLTVIVLGTISSFEYHMFYSYLIVGFLFVFLPISNTFSLDRLLLKLKYSNTRFNYVPPQTVSVIYYYMTILLGVGFVYFDSVFFKLSSHLWLSGLGLWLPSSTPESVFINITPVLNLKYLVIGLGYLTLLFEAIFLFTFWRKKWRVPLLIIGVGLHMGILVCFPIPFFAIGVAGIYLLMLPVKYWQRLFSRNENSKKSIRFYYDAECPLCNRTKIIINHFDSGNHIKFLTVQHDSINEPALAGIQRDMLLDNIYSVSGDKVYIGFDTYIHVLNVIWYLRPLSWLLRVPGIYQLGKYIYRSVAINRTTERCTEDSCGFVLRPIPVNDNQKKLLTNLSLRDLKAKILFLVLIILVLFQVLVTYNSPLLVKARYKIGIADLQLVKASENFAYKSEDFSKAFFGITHHGVFMDSHFNGYNHTIAVVYKSPTGQEKWLPIFDQDGTPGNYLFGALWVKWTFRVDAPLIKRQQFLNGIRDFTAFWAYNNGIDLRNAVFEIKVKKSRDPKVWEKDFLNTQLKNPWLEAGTVTWTNNTFSQNVKIIEKM